VKVASSGVSELEDAMVGSRRVLYVVGTSRWQFYLNSDTGVAGRWFSRNGEATGLLTDLPR
jgi:hypothetical protein